MDAKTFKEFRSHEWNIGVVSHYTACDSCPLWIIIKLELYVSVFAANAAFKLWKAQRFSSSDNTASTIAFRHRATYTVLPLSFIFLERAKVHTHGHRNKVSSSSATSNCIVLSSQPSLPTSTTSLSLSYILCFSFVSWFSLFWVLYREIKVYFLV